MNVFDQAIEKDDDGVNDFVKVAEIETVILDWVWSFEIVRLHEFPFVAVDVFSSLDLDTRESELVGELLSNSVNVDER